jgi:hypothetical protein
VIGRAASIAVLLAAVAGCSFQRRSSEYACDVPADCGAGRTCENGWCVEIGGPVIDADPSAPDADPNAPDGATPDAFVCPLGCTTCEGEICVITCNTSDVGAPCNAAPIVCPAGVACKVECLAGSSCASGVDCSQSSNCRIECTGTSACDGPLTCGEGPCHIECDDGTCTGGIDCREACQCQTFCAGGSSCMPLPMCKIPTGGGDCVGGQDECVANQIECMTCGG